jgi:transcriptional regulator with XRE-family HTH domain
MVDTADFQEWLKSELEKRSWSQSELGRASHFTRQAINAVLKYRRSPGFDLCLGIAHAFNLSPQEVLVRAHLMNPPPKYDPDTARILHKIAELKPEYIPDIEDLIDAKLKRQKQPVDGRVKIRTGKTPVLNG